MNSDRTVSFLSFHWY